MKTKFFLIAAIALGLGINNANAQVKQQAHTQHQRIKNGVKSGELTKKEAKDLAGDQRELHKDVKLAKADGHVSKGEKKILKKEAKKNSKEIYRKKHNKKDRG
ncbi:MAG: hypothetical protein ABIP35_14315 [Ginsengibacter sp.]